MSTTNKPSQEEERFIAEQTLARRKAQEREEQLEALNEQEIAGVLGELKINDRELASHLVELGFGADTVAAFPLIPLVYVAWADDAVTSRERSSVLEAAEARGLQKESAAYRFLEDLLERPPRPEFLHTCVKAIRRIFESSGVDADKAKGDLVSLSVTIAEASGGFLGLFGEKVNEQEQERIQEIVEDLGFADSASARDLLHLLRS
jgi:hypothetical protein